MALYLAQHKLPTKSTLGPNWLIISALWKGRDKLPLAVFWSVWQVFGWSLHIYFLLLAQWMVHLAQAGLHYGQCRKSTRLTRELNFLMRFFSSKQFWKQNCSISRGMFIAWKFRSCSWTLWEAAWYVIMNPIWFKKQTKKFQTTSPPQKPNQNQNNDLKQLFIQANFSFIFNLIPEIIIVQTLSIKVAIRNLHSHLTFQSIHFLT